MPITTIDFIFFERYNHHKKLANHHRNFSVIVWNHHKKNAPRNKFCDSLLYNHHKKFLL